MRARDHGIIIGDLPTGRNNAITDVPGVRVGHETIIAGDGPRVVGEGPVRTGVTVIQPHEGNVWLDPVFAGAHRLNGSGEMTGLEWIRENGMLTSPIAITNTHSVGVVRDALIAAEFGPRAGKGPLQFALPVVAETFDGILNDIDGFHVRPEHVDAALADASDGPVLEGNVGGGTGMICHGFKGGIGTSSRTVTIGGEQFTLGVLVQANHGRRDRLTINGVRVGRDITHDVVPDPAREMAALLDPGSGSCIVIIATDAPLLPTQCERVAQRAVLGMGRIGSTADPTSGDLVLCFSNSNRGLPPLTFGVPVPDIYEVRSISNRPMSVLFDAVVEATEEAIVNALFGAEDLTGADGLTVRALPHELCVDALSARGALS